jgi:hypothetical protein
MIKSRNMRLAGDAECMEERWKPEENRPLGRPRRRWEDNIRMFLRERGREGVDWIHLAQDWTNGGLTVMNLRVP